MLIILIFIGISLIIYGIKIKGNENSNDFKDVLVNIGNTEKEADEVIVEEGKDIILDRINLIEGKIESLGYVLDNISIKIEDLSLSNNTIEEIDNEIDETEDNEELNNNELNDEELDNVKLPNHSNELLEKIKNLENENKSIEEISKELNIGKGEILLLKSISTK